MIPGEFRLRPEAVELNAGRECRTLLVVNAGDRPIQVGSHVHLPDANSALQFDRDQAEGFRLDLPAGTSVRLEPGVSRMVDLVALGGRKRVPGLQIKTDTNAPSPKEKS
ncbi:urease subunit beta [Rhodococcus sp. 1168]|uniref:urease subunit beta n=1 Tax=Rhodococcus sp. 1168 TaxID=2018041 RepID=UPI000A0E19F8|nr:urease subunit beta [Rhodococcus sp. 1168]ORI26646.1 urease subunit beta [Rhodococcus sp. 1168]